MNERVLKLLTVVALLLPALSAATMRLTVRNGTDVSSSVVAAVRIKNGEVIVVPDVIFRAGF